MTTRELARLAGVSSATVSLALRNHPRISAATKARIARLVRKHNYVVDGRVTELMRSIRRHAGDGPTSSLGLISLYPEERPWANRERPGHLARLHRSMVKRAGEMGYRVEEFWVRNPAMNPARLAMIIETRGIRGLLSLGAPELEDEIPEELQRFVIVTQGASIRTKLHRVGSHFSHNATLLLEQLKARGYRRPGAVLQSFQDGRNAHVVAAMYLYFSKYAFGGIEIPILYAEDSVDQGALRAWYRAHLPDVIIYADHGKHYASLQAFFDRERISIPDDLGLAVLDAAVHPPGISGVRQAVEQMGISAVDMLVSRLQQGDSGLPRVAKIEKVEGDWVEDGTLRAVIDPPVLVPV
jgi:DNA-binding LacI/PurR family transcriptional regulator